MGVSGRFASAQHLNSVIFGLLSVSGQGNPLCDELVIGDTSHLGITCGIFPTDRMLPKASWTPITTALSPWASYAASSKAARNFGPVANHSGSELWRITPREFQFPFFFRRNGSWGSPWNWGTFFRTKRPFKKEFLLLCLLPRRGIFGTWCRGRRGAISNQHLHPKKACSLKLFWSMGRFARIKNQRTNQKAKERRPRWICWVASPLRKLQPAFDRVRLHLGKYRALTHPMKAFWGVPCFPVWEEDIFRDWEWFHRFCFLRVSWEAQLHRVC